MVVKVERQRDVVDLLANSPVRQKVLGPVPFVRSGTRVEVAYEVTGELSDDAALEALGLT